MARNREFDDALDELKMLHDAKNHDYATAENPYKNLEGVARIGIEPWRGKESEGNAETIKRIHSRVDQIQTSYKTLKGVGMFIVASLTAVGAWFGLIDSK